MPVLLGIGIDQILNGATSPNSKTASSYRKPTLDLATSSALDLPEGYYSFQLCKL